MASSDLTKDAILNAMMDLSERGIQRVSSSQLGEVKASPATIRRHLEDLVTSGQLIRTGKARATRYQLATRSNLKEHVDLNAKRDGQPAFPMSSQSQALLEILQQPLAARSPVTYQREFVDSYIPNETSLLPRSLADSLFKEGRMHGQQPAGTYARKVLEPLLIDLSWSSSRLEGNRHSLLETEELFKRGTEGDDADAVMLLNHKRAIEFLVEAVPEYGLTNPLIRNLHSLLMQDLLSDQKGLGEIRSKIVNIRDTVYVPSQVPTLLGEMLNQIIERAKQIKNPIEAAFFLWVNTAYLQPFEDGNKRTSRLAANIPLMIYNCAPLSFLDVDAQNYAYAMMGVYEVLDTSLAVDLFAWIYRRSIQKYTVVMESFGVLDPFRVKYREQLSNAVLAIIRDGRTKEDAINGLLLPERDKMGFASMLTKELAALTTHNCARYRVAMKMVDEWIKNGRPA
jgi:Fic family protein